MERDHAPEVGAYLVDCASFAQPILAHIRKVVHVAQRGIEQAIKWLLPPSLWKSKIALGTAAFKAHVALGFWNGEIVAGAIDVEREAIGSFGKLTALADLPPDEELAAMVRNACDLIDHGFVARHMSKRHKRPELPTPPALRAALDTNLKAKLNWTVSPPRCVAAS